MRGEIVCEERGEIVCEEKENRPKNGKADAQMWRVKG